MSTIFKEYKIGVIIYMFVTISVVLLAGWAFYILPFPGELTPWELTGALLPAVIILAGVIVTLLVFGAILLAVVWLYRAIRSPK